MQQEHSPKRAYGYTRVSSEKQAQDGDSLDMQKRVIEAICIAEGYDLAGIFAEPGISGSVPFAGRGQGAALLDVVEHGDIIVCLKLDRAFRDTHDALGTLKALKARGVGLFIKDMGGDITGSDVSALMFTLLSAVATFERGRIAERVRESKRYLRTQGRHQGGSTQFGFMKVTGDDGKLYLRPDAVIHAEARVLKDRGYSARLAAGHFRGQGHTCTHATVGKLWRDMGA